MQAGELNTKIVIQKKSGGTGVYGQSSWADFKTVYAKWVDINSVETLKDDATKGFSYATVTIRTTADLTAECKIKKGGNQWDVLGAPKEIGKTGFIEFKVERAVAG